MLGYLSPSINVFAEQRNSLKVSSELTNTINETLEEAELSWGEINNLYDIASTALTVNVDGTYRFDSSVAIQLGVTPGQAHELKLGYESLTAEQINAINNLEGENFEVKDPETGLTFVIALPILLNALLALGAAWLVNEILNLGAYQACKKWKNSSKSPKLFKKYCDAKGW